MADSELLRLFPKPSEWESPAVMLRWESRREGYLIALSEVLRKFKDPNLSYYREVEEWVEQEIKAVEENK